MHLLILKVLWYIFFLVEYYGLAEMQFGLQSLPNHVQSHKGFGERRREATLLPDTDLGTRVQIFVRRNQTRVTQDRKRVALFRLCRRHETRGKGKLLFTS